MQNIEAESPNTNPNPNGDEPQAEGLVREKGLFPARDGTTLYYEIRGQGKPLVFCYGLLCRREHWRHQIRHFARDYQVISFDYRGHQSSAKPLNDQHLTLEWCARDIQDLMNHLRLEEAVCFGHSMGVPVLTHAALLEPKRIRAVVLICGSVTNPFENMFYSNRLDRLSKAAIRLYDLMPTLMNGIWQRLTEKSRLNFFLTSRLGFNATRAEEEDILMYMEGVNQTPFSVFQALLRDYRQFDGRKVLPKIQCPSLVVAGEEDCITPVELQAEIAELLPRGELQIVPEGSHNAHMDFPHVVNRLIQNFLKKIGF